MGGRTLSQPRVAAADSKVAQLLLETDEHVPQHTLDGMCFCDCLLRGLCILDQVTR